MSDRFVGELVWCWVESEMELVLRVSEAQRERFHAAGTNKYVQVTSLQIPWVTEVAPATVIHTHPIQGSVRHGKLVAGPVFAILAGPGGPQFAGSRTNFRDIMRQARRRRKFVFVVPADHVRPSSQWVGYVRSETRKWLELPCPQPETVYNRVPTRNIERLPAVIQAKAVLDELGIPIFNPRYFNKSEIYRAIRESGAGAYLPETACELKYSTLMRMLTRHASVYLKPVGGSVGYGILRIDQNEAGDGAYLVSVQRSGTCVVQRATSALDTWRLVEQHRVPGAYVIQQGISLIQWQGRPCDFRLLLQKRANRWRVVGKGVRVSGEGSITSHVPNGGSIMNAQTVLQTVFPETADQVERDLNRLAMQCALAIDRKYHGQLAEMSMDIGVDADGGAWFLEANSKPMKFDEPDIRSKSLEGVVAIMEELKENKITVHHGLVN